MTSLFGEIFSFGIKPTGAVILKARKEVKDMKNQNRQTPQNKNQNCPTNQKNQQTPENKKKDAPESHKTPESKF